MCSTPSTMRGVGATLPGSMRRAARVPLAAAAVARCGALARPLEPAPAARRGASTRALAAAAKRRSALCASSSRMRDACVDARVAARRASAAARAGSSSREPLDEESAARSAPGGNGAASRSAVNDMPALQSGFDGPAGSRAARSASCVIARIRPSARSTHSAFCGMRPRHADTNATAAAASARRRRSRDRRWPPPPRSRSRRARRRAAAAQHRIHARRETRARTRDSPPCSAASSSRIARKRR